MSLEFDKEIDSLLREGARHGRGASVEGGTAAGRGDFGVRATPAGAHLDADELNAYAENALPPRARAHHAAHLADCDDCRRSVTTLALAAGMPAQLEQREAATAAAGAAQQKVSPVAGWRERLGALLAPRAWRYAVPALALLLVGAVALVIFMRDRQGETSLARRNESERAKPTLTQTEQHHAAQQNNNAAAATTNENTTNAPNSNAPATATREETADLVIDGMSEGQAQPKPGIVTSDDAPVPQSPPAPATGSGAVTRAITEMPTPSPLPPPAVAEPANVTAERETKTKTAESVGEVAKDSAQRQADYQNMQREQAANARRDERLSGPRRNSNNDQARNSRAMNTQDSRDRADNADRNVAATASAPAPSAAARRASQRDADRERDEAKPSDSSLKSENRRAPESSAGETRSVGGRRFRKQGGAWVDTAYSAGQSYTVVRRNSEQYRALVADEPAIGRISNALGGEVTIVWKGRAYRIR